MDPEPELRTTSLIAYCPGASSAFHWLPSQPSHFIGKEEWNGKIMKSEKAQTSAEMESKKVKVNW